MMKSLSIAVILKLADIFAESECLGSNGICYKILAGKLPQTKQFLRLEPTYTKRVSDDRRPVRSTPKYKSLRFSHTRNL